MDDDERQWTSIDEDELPTLSTEEGRDSWAEILLQQDDETLEENGMGWMKCLVASEGSNMVARLVYEDGSEEVLDLEIRRRIAVVTHDEGEQN